MGKQEFCTELPFFVSYTDPELTLICESRYYRSTNKKDLVVRLW